MKNKKSFLGLFIPIFIELIFIMGIGFADTFMLSAVGDQQVGAVGTSNSYMQMFTLAFSIISAGMVAVLTQYIGANKENVASKILKIGLEINLVVGLIISFIFIFFTKDILRLMAISPALEEYAITYTFLLGGSSILGAITPIYSYYLRAFGFTKGPLISTFISNIINVSLNALFIYAFKMGVFGVALSSVISKIFNLVCNMIIKEIAIKVSDAPCEESSLKLLGQIIKVGLPAAAETIMYSISMSIVMMLINKMDNEGFNAIVKTYGSNLTTFSYMGALAIAQANAIQVGWKAGEGKIEECYKMTIRRLFIGICVGMGSEILLALLGYPISSLLTKDKEILRILQIVLLIDILLEFGRSTNLIMGNALKCTGDAFFTVVISIVFTLLFAVGGTFLFGTCLKMNIIGVWIGLSLDECARGVCMIFRWKSRKWENKIFIKKEARLDEEEK